MEAAHIHLPGKLDHYPEEHPDDEDEDDDDDDDEEYDEESIFYTYGVHYNNPTSGKCNRKKPL